MNNNIEDLRNVYQQIEIPKDLDKAINKGIKRGRFEMKSKKKQNNVLKGLCACVAVIVAFTVSVNAFPVFADSMSGIPGVGKLVKILQLNNGKASGGEITDGVKAELEEVQKNENSSETLTINFNKDGITSDMASHYDIVYNKYPYSMIFTLSGARQLSLEPDLEKLKKCDFVSDVYKLITLDDSMVRFAVTLKQPVKYEVREYKEPAQLVVTFTNGTDAAPEPQVYSLRSISYPFGEKLGMLEEQFFSIETSRILKDREGTFLVEVGYFDSEQKAQQKLKELTESFGPDLKLHIEKRNPADIPKVIKE